MRWVTRPMHTGNVIGLMARVVKAILRPRCRMNIGPHLQVVLACPTYQFLERLPAIPDNPRRIIDRIVLAQNVMRQGHPHVRGTRLFQGRNVLFRHERLQVRIEPFFGNGFGFKPRPQVVLVHGIIDASKGIDKLNGFALVYVAKRRIRRSVELTWIPTKVTSGMAIGNGKLRMLRSKET